MTRASPRPATAAALLLAYAAAAAAAFAHGAGCAARHEAPATPQQTGCVAAGSAVLHWPGPEQILAGQLAAAAQCAPPPPPAVPLRACL
eukprot:1154646-Pelagomonas_calceolata.AAC.1